tara:strand:- start:89070 stop:89384 length:315 start_codon:yes stop_codon:yes gene_type:complete
MDRITYILEDHVHIIRNEISKEFNTVNGIADKVIIETTKANFLKDNLAHLTDILVDENKSHYPEDGKVKKDFSMMFAVIKSEHLMELIRAVEDMEDRLCKCSRE